MAGFLADKGLRILRNGYNLIPIQPGQKSPSVKGWEQTQTTEKQLNGWVSNGRASHGVGIPTRETPFVDLDIQDLPCLRFIVDWIELNFGFAPTRIGNAPKRGLLFRTREPFRKVSSKIYRDPEGRKAQVEVLGDGQQFVAFAIHPDTGKPYRWIHGGESPETAAAGDLPELNEFAARRTVKAFEDWCEAQGWQRTNSKNNLPVPTERPGFLDADDIGDNSNEPCGLTDDEIREKLMVIPNDDRFDAREDWLKIGFAIHHETDGSEFGHDLWHEWSDQHPSHDTELLDKAWNSFGKRDDARLRGVTFRFVLKLATEYERKAKAEELGELIGRMDFAKDIDELRTIAADCRKLDVDLIDRSRLIAAFQKSVRVTTGNGLGLREAREMVRYRPDTAEAPDWLDGWCYLTHAKQFYNRQTGERMEREAFDIAFGRNIGTETTASKFAVDAVKIPIFHMTIYLPSEGETFTDPAGLEWINTYSTKYLPLVPEKLSERDRANIEIVKNHAIHLFGKDAREIAIFHSWLAYIVQTNRRPNWAIIMQGAEGTGKSFYAQMMAAVLGGPNIYTLGADTLQRSDFTAWAEGHQLIFIEELKQHGHNRFDVPNKLKPYISNTTVEIHPKRINPYNVPNTAAYMAATNYRDALPLGESDSRYFVLMSVWQRKPDIDKFKTDNPDYYPRLWQAVEESPGAIRKWLLAFKLHTEFDPSERAPFSHGKDRMIQEAKSDEQQDIEELIADGVHPLVSRDLIAVHILRELIADEQGQLPGRLASAVGTRHVLTDMGYASLPRVRIGTERFSCWSTNHELALSNHDQIKKLILARIEAEKEL